MQDGIIDEMEITMVRIITQEYVAIKITIDTKTAFELFPMMEKANPVWKYHAPV